MQYLVRYKVSESSSNTELLNENKCHFQTNKKKTFSRDCHGRSPFEGRQEAPPTCILFITCHPSSTFLTSIYSVSLGSFSWSKIWSLWFSQRIACRVIVSNFSWLPSSAVSLSRQWQRHYCRYSYTRRGSRCCHEQALVTGMTLYCCFHMSIHIISIIREKKPCV